MSLKKTRYVLPLETDPEGRKCFAVYVPDDPYHIAAFKGQIYGLTFSRVWEKDPTHQAADVARVWQDIFDNLEECAPMFDVRIDPESNCTLQKTTDGGVTWEDVGSFQDCAQDAARDVIGGYIDDGILGPGGQQSPGGSGVQGQCYDYDVNLSANQRWHCPLPLEQRDTVEISDWRGGWYDGAVGQAWNCPDGQSYLLGNCTSLGEHTDEDDPMPDVYHMKLVVNLPDQAVDWVDIEEGIYTVPVDESTSELFIQANDSVLTDNQGSVTFHVQICKGVTPSAAVYVDAQYTVEGARDVALDEWHTWHSVPVIGEHIIRFSFKNKDNHGQFVAVDIEVGGQSGWSNQDYVWDGAYYDSNHANQYGITNSQFYVGNYGEIDGITEIEWWSHSEFYFAARVRHVG